MSRNIHEIGARTVLTTRAIGDKAGMDYDRDLGGLLAVADHVGAHSHLSTQQSYKDLPAIAEWVAATNGRMSMSLSSTDKNVSPSDMLNNSIRATWNLKRDYLGIVSADFIPEAQTVFPVVLERLHEDPNLAMIGPALVGVHNIPLLQDVKAGKAFVTAENIAMLFVNDALDASRVNGLVDAHGKAVDQHQISFSPVTDNGFLGEGKGGNEELEKLVRMVRYGIAVKFVLLAEQLITRDANKEASIAQAARESVPDKVARRPSVFKLFTDYHGVTAEQINNYLAENVQIVF